MRGSKQPTRKQTTTRSGQQTQGRLPPRWPRRQAAWKPQPSSMRNGPPGPRAPGKKPGTPESSCSVAGSNHPPGQQQNRRIRPPGGETSRCTLMPWTARSTASGRPPSARAGRGRLSVSQKLGTKNRTPPRPGPDLSPGSSGEHYPRPRRSLSPGHPSRELRSPRLRDLAPLMTGVPRGSMSCRPAWTRPHAASTRNGQNSTPAVSILRGSNGKHAPNRKLTRRQIRPMKWTCRRSDRVRVYCPGSRASRYPAGRKSAALSETAVGFHGPRSTVPSPPSSVPSSRRRVSRA